MVLSLFHHASGCAWSLLILPVFSASAKRSVCPLPRCHCCRCCRCCWMKQGSSMRCERNHHRRQLFWSLLTTHFPFVAERLGLRVGAGRPLTPPHHTLCGCRASRQPFPPLFLNHSFARLRLSSLSFPSRHLTNHRTSEYVCPLKLSQCSPSASGTGEVRNCMSQHPLSSQLAFIHDCNMTLTSTVAGVVWLRLCPWSCGAHQTHEPV
jgi:hypothetical protein